MTSIFSLSSEPPASPSKTSVHLMKVLGGIGLTPHLVRLDKAQPGDLLGMMSSFYTDMDQFPNQKHRLPVFFVQAEAGVEVRVYRQLVGSARDHAARVLAEEIILGEDVHLTVLRYDMVQETEVYDLHVVYFADAILYINDSWLCGEFDYGYDVEQKAELRPIILKMGAVSKIDEIAACHHRTCRYLDTARQMFPLEWRDKANWNVVLPPSSAYFSLEPDPFVRA